MEKCKFKYPEAVKKSCAALCIFILLALGIACGGGGGSSAVVWPVLPEGTLYFNEDGLAESFRNQPPFDTDYVEVTPVLDNVLAPLPANPLETANALGVMLFINGYGEDGFILAIEPDDPVQDIARLSIALHTRGMNFTKETVDFIAEDPVNQFMVMEIMAGLEGSGAAGMLRNGVVGCVPSITAGGRYIGGIKEGAEEIVDSYYSLLPPLARLIVSKEQFQSYLSQQIYNSEYDGGGEVSFTELLGMFLEPWNWERLDFKVTLELEVAVSGFIKDVTAAADAAGIYDQNNLNRIALGNRIYRGEGTDNSPVITAFPSEIGGRVILTTAAEDAGWSGDDFLVFDLGRPVVLYVAVDGEMEVAEGNVLEWLATNGWELCTGKTITATMPESPYTQNTYALYCKEYTDVEVYPLAISLPGNGDAAKNMYFVIGDAETYPLGMEVIVTAHTVLMQDNPADVAAYMPSEKSEGGIVVNNNGIDEGGAQIGDEYVDLVHADFVQNFDANVFVNTEGGGSYYQSHRALADVENIQFVEHILTNNGFRLIDTYNDRYPAFGGPNQVLLIENILGISVSPPHEMELHRDNLATFTNMNLLNSPNLIGVYLKSAVTNTGIPIWKEEGNDRGLNYSGIMEYLIANNGGAVYTYYRSDNGSQISLVDLLKRIGNRSEGELTFRVLISFPEEKTLEISAGAFIQDYFTNVYDAAMGFSPAGDFSE